MVEELRQRFDANIARAEGFLALYTEGADGRGRAAVQSTDLLRAAVVFSHAAVEDLLRTSAYARLHQAAPDKLAGMLVPVAGRPKGAEKVTISQIAQYRDRTVQELIQEAVDSHLERATYNNVEEIIDIMRRLELDSTRWDDRERANIGALMARRHQIVHRVDWNPSRGRGHHQAVSLQRSTVETWLASAKRFGALIIELLDDA